MSVQAITWALAHEVQNATEKAVLLVLANYADGDGVCFPGQESIAQQAACSDRTVRRVLDDFEARGVIKRRHRQRRDGSRTSDEILLMAFQPDTVSTRPTGHHDRKANRTPCPIQPDTVSTRPTGHHDRKANRTPCPIQPDTVSGLTTFEPSEEPSDSSVPDGTGPSAPPAAPDHDKQAWSEAVRIITNVGVSERSARSFFGKLLSEHGLLARDLLPSLMAASVNATGDPQSYLTRAAVAVASRRRASSSEPRRTDPADWTPAYWAQAVALWRETGRWSDALGPPPDDPHCRAPPSALEEPQAA